MGESYPRHAHCHTSVVEATLDTMTDDLDRAVEIELRRRSTPPFRPDYALIVCRHCGNRMFDDDGNTIRCHRWWQ